MKESKFNLDYIKQASEIPRLVWWNLSKKNNPQKPKLILIVNTCLIGDIAASIHSLVQFIKKRPYAKVDVIVPSTMKGIIEKVRGINKVYTAKSVTERSIEKISVQDRDEITKNNYDLIVVIRLSKDAHNILKKINFNEIQISPLSYVRYILHLLKHIVYKGNPRYDGKVKQYKEANFEWIGEKYTMQKMDFDKIFNFSKEDYKKIEEIEVMKGDSKRIIIHAGTGWKKNWENKKWVELLNKINKLGRFSFIFIGAGAEEEKDFEIIQKNLNFKPYSLINKINLAELLLVMKMSDYFIGIDSGPRNLAHLVGLRSVSLLGPGPKHFMPYSKKDIIIDKSVCKCTQLFCFKEGICMKDITVEDVFDGFKKLVRIKT